MRRAAAARRETKKDSDSQPRTDHPAILFDLDGTLLDSNYEHVLAWLGGSRCAAKALKFPMPFFIAASV